MCLDFCGRHPLLLLLLKFFAVSDVIDDQEVRTELYEEAMGYILDLAVELPVYQRQVLYAYNAKVIDASSMPSEINPYTSPLDKMWLIEFAD